MAEENVSQVKEIIEETSVQTMPLMVEKIHRVNVNGNVNGALDKRGPPGKAQAQTRYRGNQTSSTHDLRKHGKRREDGLVIQPWKLVKQKNVEGGGDLVKGETLSLMRKSMGNVSRPEKSLQVPKRDATASEVVKSCDGLRQRSETKSSKEDILKHMKNKEKNTKIDEPVRCVNVLEKKVSRISETKSSKENLIKSLKNKEKTEIDEPVRCDDVLEKTLYVVESSIEEKMMKKKKIIKSVKSEIHQSSDKKILRGNGKKSPTLIPSLSPSSERIRQITSRSKTGLYEKKKSSSETHVTSSKTESKTMPKRIGLKDTPLTGPPTRPMSFKKGKVLELKQEDSTPTWIKFKKRVVQEPRLRSDGNKKKKNMKDRRESVGKMSFNIGEGKREKVVLRHRKVEAKKKLQTLFNNVIEETMNKLEDVRKSKVKALVGAFETVISLQDNDKTSQKKKIQSKSTSSQVVEG